VSLFEKVGGALERLSTTDGVDAIECRHSTENDSPNDVHAHFSPRQKVSGELDTTLQVSAEE
jgi:hypothetical protein